jgi:hypothetical protein
MTQGPVDRCPRLGENPDDRVFLLRGQELQVKSVENKYRWMSWLDDTGAAGIASPGPWGEIQTVLDIGATTLE